MCCVWRHLLRYMSPTVKDPGAALISSFIMRKLFGVRRAISSTSGLNLVMGRPFMIPSTSHSTVSKISSVKRTLRCNTPRNTFRIVRIILSYTPPICEACGGLNVHIMSLFRQNDSIGSRTTDFNARFNSLWPPTMLVPLSQYILCGVPLRLVNRLRALMKLSESSVSSFSI